MPDKKYLIEIPDMPEGSGIWEADKWERNKDAFMKENPTAKVFEMGAYDAEDTNENDQILISMDDEESSGLWDSDKWERNKEAFMQENPTAQISRVRYQDYWGNRATAIEDRLAELDQPNQERAARLAEIGYFDDNNSEANLDVNLKPVSQAMKINSVSGDVEYLDPAVEEFFANDDAYTQRELEKNQLKAEYETNPSVIAQREWEAKRKEAEKAYRGELKQQITADYEANVDKNKAARGGIEIDGVPVYGPASIETEKQDKYLAALQLLDFADRMEKGEKFWEGVGYGATKAAVDYDGKEMQQVGLAFKKLEDRGINILEATEEDIDEALDPEDKALMRAYLEYEKAMYEADPSRAFKGGAQFGETIPFILEFVATGDIYKAGAKKAMEMAGKKAIGKGFAKWIAKSAGKKIPTLMKQGVAKTTTGTIKALGGTLTRTVAAPTTYTKMTTPDIQISDTGDVSVETHAAREFFDHYIENLSEISGEGMVAGLGGAAKLLNSTKIGKMPFMKLGEWLGNKAVWQGLSKLGAQSLPIEVAEEVVGNALRYVTGVDKDALGRMFEKDEFASMLIGFAPLTVLGMGTSAAAMGAVNISAATAQTKMRDALNPYYTEQQIDDVTGALERAKTSDEVVEALKPILVGMHDATQEEKTAVMDYAIKVAKKKAMISARNFQEMQLSDAAIRQVEDKVGRFWIENEDKSRTVRQVNLNDGRQVFVVSQPNEAGEVATVEVDTGKKGMAKLTDIKEEIFNSSLESYGTRFVMADRKAKEQERMAKERQVQINLVRQNLAAQKGRINLGTEGAPIMVVADAETEAGVHYVAENGSTGTLSWEQVADAQGTPIIVKTDAQIVEKEIADIVARDAERKAQRAQEKGRDEIGAAEAVAEADETISAVDAQTKHIPLNEDGTVNEAAFWEQDPEGYAQWNDEQNQDGGADTIQQIEAAKAELTAMLNEAQRATLTSNPANRKAAKREVSRLAERLARLEALEQSYADRALAPLRERAKMWADLTGAPVHVIETEEELAAISSTAASENAKQGSRVRGFAKDGRAYIFLPGIKDIKEIDEVFFHEAVAHNGLKGLLGKENYDKLCEQVWNMMSQAARNQFIRYPGVNGDYLAAADEYIAHIAEKMGAGITEAEEKTIWQKIVDFVRNVLREMGVELNVTEQELSDLLHQAYADLANNMAKAEQIATGEAMSAVEEASSEARQQYDALLEDLTPEEIEAVAQNDFNAAQEAYNAHLANTPKVEPGESSKAYIERKKAYNNELKRLEAELNAQQALMDEIAKAKQTETEDEAIEPVEDLAENNTRLSAVSESAAEGEDVRFSKKTKAPETAVQPMAGHSTVVSSADGANVIKNLETLLVEYRNKPSNRQKTFIGDLARALGLRNNGNHSNYGTFEAVNGEVFTYRISDHNSSTKNMEDAGNPNGISIVITHRPNSKITKDGNAHIVEFYYNTQKLLNADGQPYADIIQSVIQSLYSGEYKDTTGLAEMDEAVSFSVVTPPMDAEYLAAVEAGDMKTAQRMVLEAAKLAMPNTKVVDKKGNPAVVHHGTKGKFNTFAYSREDIGFHFGTKGTARTRIGRGKDARIMQVFLNLENPLIFDTDLGSWDADYIVKDLLKKEMMSYDDAKAILLTPNGYKRNSVSALVDLRQWMSNNGYDGIVYPNWYESDGKDSYIAFNRNQIKSADSVTYDNNGNVIPLSQRFNPAKEDIRFSARTDEQRQALFDKAKAQFGLTNNFKVAGYMLPDGSLLDFSEANNGGNPNQRSLDHREIEGIIMDEGKEYDSRWMYLADFMNEGAIRLLPEYAGINLMKAPTKEQRQKLFDFIYKYNGEVILEIADERLNNVAYVEYDLRTSPSRIFRDIDGYFNEGIVPQQDVRFSIANENQAIFVSNAARAVEGIKMEKATPEQWLKMIEKSGGLKTGEDKWMGLSDWLKSSDKKTLTKQEVLDFINEHKIVIEEERYGEVELSALQDEFNEIYDSIIDNVGNEDESNLQLWEVVMNPMERAWEELRDRYSGGDDFDMAFSYDRQGNIEINDPDAAGYFLGVKPINDTRLNYTTSGLQNKQEIALVVPNIEPWNESDDIHFGDAGEGRAVAWVRFGETYTEDTTSEINEYLKGKYSKEDFEAGNFTEEDWNKLIDARKHGNKVLVIDEIQSMRHQEGREKGYRVTNVDKWLKDNNVEVVETGEFFEFIKDGQTDKRFSRGLMRYDIEKAKRLYVNGFSKTDVPDAPFDKNWSELAMKRMLRYAAENGYDAIAWTKGEQQADRYNLGKIYNEIEREDNPNIKGRTFSFSGGNYDKVTVNEDGVVVDSTIEEAKGKSLSDLVGKDLAVKMMSLENYDTIDGEDLRIGGEGMKGFYDKMLPAFMNKYGKRWGIKVADITLPYVEDAGRVMHSVPVTEEMKASVMEGQVMFSVRTVNQTAQEFHNDALTDFRRQFNLIQPTAVVDINDRAALAEALGEELSDEKYQLILDGVNNGGRSFYDDDTKRIAIFALEEQRTSAEVSENIFHENTHAIISKNPELLELGQWLWDNAKPGIRMKTRNSILDSNYPEWQYANEMLSRYTGAILAIGRAGEVLNMLPADQKKHWEFILKEFGYEPEREDGERIRRYDADSRRAGFFRKMSQQKMSDNGAAARYSAEERRVINELFPGAIQEEINVGDFGEIYEQFKRKPKEAIAFLMEKQSGEAVGALYHPEIGEIDLVWGEAGTGKSDGYGLAKLVKFHPEVIENLQDILSEMHIVKQSANRINLESEKYQAAVRLTWNNKAKKWLLTAFEKKNSALDNTTDTGETSNGSRQNDTATLQDTVSDNKDSDNSENSNTLFSVDTETEIKAIKSLSILDSMNISLEQEMVITREAIDAERKRIAELNKRLGDKDLPVLKKQIENAEDRLKTYLRQMEILQDVEDKLIKVELVEPDVRAQMANLEPQNAFEYLSELLTMHLTPIVQTKVVDADGKETIVRQGGKKKGVMLTPETLEKELGYSKSDWKGISYIVSESEGMSLDAIAEMIEQDFDASHIFGSMDTMEIKDVIIDFLQSMSSYTEIRDYIKNERERMAKEEAERINGRIQQAIEEIESQYGMSIDEYNAMLIQEERGARERWLEENENPERFAKFEQSNIEDNGQTSGKAGEASKAAPGATGEGSEGGQASEGSGNVAGSGKNVENPADGGQEAGAGNNQGNGNGGENNTGDQGGNTATGVVPDNVESGKQSVDEIVESGKQKVLQQNADAADTLMDRIRAINGNLQQLRMMAAAQREYDKQTVKAITDLANELLTDGALSDMTRGEIKRLLSVIKDATGKSDLTISVDRLMDIMIGNQLRYGRNRFEEYLKIRGKKVDARGVEVRGKLDVEGQQIMDAVREGISLDLDRIQDRISAAEDKLFDSSQTISRNAEHELAGLEIAKQYVENIKESESEEKDLRKELKDAKDQYDAGVMEKTAYKEFVKATHDAIRDNRMQRVIAYENLLSDMADMVKNSILKAGQLREAEKARVERIQHFANSDMQGMPADEHQAKTNKFWNNPIVRFLLKPLATFDQMLRHFAPKSRSGEGYLWNHFMGGWLKATENEYKGIQAAHEKLDAKVKSVFGNKVNRWSDLFTIERDLPKATISFWDAGEIKDFEVMQGNLLYIYMVNKMTDGKMKLRKMGINEEDVINMARELDPRFLELADWLQEEFLPGLREKYNAVHERLFGAPMAAIDNYFPIRVLANARSREVDINIEESNAKPSTITGNIMKRTKNSLALDILGSDAFDVILGHIEDMEKWAAFAEWNKDLNTLLSYKKFRNRVQNMSGIYGAGSVVWNNFRSVAEIAAGVYKPATKADSVDKTIMNIAKGVTGAKISFRVYTALKQLLSWPAFISDANPVILAKNMANPFKAWNWAMENLPLFEKRWKSRQAGDSRLMQTDADWKLWKAKAVEIAGRLGMTPNAFIDAVTVAIGARAVYETRLKQYLDYGYDQEKAEQKAKRDATVVFNESQQSNESAFLSQIQLDRTVASVVLTVFRNSSMGYQRMYIDALRNISHMSKKGYKAESIEYIKKQMMRDGLSEADAERAANRIYNRSFVKNAVQALTFGFIVQLAWNLGPYLPYIFAGDDDDKKKEMATDATVRALVGGPVEGMTGGSVLSNVLGNVAMGEKLSEVNGVQLPLSSDVENLFKLFGKDNVRAVNDIFNIVVQAGIGVNPQTITDAVVAIVDACNGDLGTATEAALCMMRLLQFPQSQIEDLYLDEIDFSADDALDLTIKEFAERYAKYKVLRSAPLTKWAYTDEKEKEREETYIKKFISEAEDLKRTRGNEEAKAFYQYYDNEYADVAESLRDLKRRAYEAEGDEVKAISQETDELVKTEEYKRYDDLISDIKSYEAYKELLKDVTDPETRKEYEKEMLKHRRNVVNKINGYETEIE